MNDEPYVYQVDAMSLSAYPVIFGIGGHPACAGEMYTRERAEEIVCRLSSLKTYGVFDDVWECPECGTLGVSEMNLSITGVVMCGCCGMKARNYSD